MSEWEAVIGLEIHVQLSTKSKLFSRAPNHFGDEPNTNITELCTAEPGSLPVLNREVVRKAIQFGLAVHSQISLESRFDRKSYFYPDLPRNYQITQFDYPILKGGTLVAEVGGETKHFSINRAHIEDDSGMLKHFTHFAAVDYNRAGVPLIEIVSEPCMHTPEEAMAYASEIRLLMIYLGASDCDMEKGSLRIDANISVRKKGETALRTKVEIKNMNSFSNMGEALTSEIRRQTKLYETGGVVQKGTYRYDLDRKETVMMRTKEEAEDYRYFPEPDLPPLILTQGQIDDVKRTLPELPHQRRERYTQLKLAKDAITLLVNDKGLSDYFESALKTCNHPQTLCNWLTVEFTGRLKEQGKTAASAGIRSEDIAELVNMIEGGAITGKIAKTVADEMVAHPGKSPHIIVKENPDLQPLTDLTQIEALVDQVLKDNAQSILDYKAGKGRAFDFLVGQVMKLCKGKASPALVNELLTKKLK